jgi:DsbC/DsbD-like thiol-disulfide interchange protein
MLTFLASDFRMHLLRTVAAVAPLVLLPVPAAAQGVPGVGSRPAAPERKVKEPRTGEDAVRMTAGVVGEPRAGATVRIAATFDIVPGWHIYWESAGESGSPTQLEVDLPDGCSIVSIERGRPRVDFPAPAVFRKGETTFGYEDSVTLSLEVKLPDTMPADGTLTARVRGSWLVCKEICLMGRGEATVDLLAPAPADSAIARGLADALARLPKPLPAEWKVRLESVTADSAVLAVDAPPSVPAGASWEILPRDTPGVLLESGYIVEAKGRGVRVPLSVSRDNALGGELAFSGVIVLGGAESGKNRRAFSFTIPIPDPASKS